MVRPWSSLLLLALVFVSSVAAVDLSRASRRQLRSDVSVASFFSSLSAKLRARDSYPDDFPVPVHRYDLARRQNDSTNSTPPSSSPSSPKPDTPDPPTNSPSPSDPPPSSSTENKPTESKSDPPAPTKTSEPEPSETSKPSPSNPPDSSTPSPTRPKPNPTQSPSESPSQEPSDESSPSGEPEEKPSPKPTPKPSPVSSTVLIPTTNADGSRSTFTSVVVVHPTPTNSPSGGSNKPPGLQTGGAQPTVDIKKQMFAVIGGAVAIAMAL
ncbi:hypothetical protein AJ79_05853 [Helicocarpus griseus UAMH5409]|uniref:Uncharacterized protein n=1 Tax=Helicocarpus griseus UAMH5409 TaxID=1447875 RepID=A0A2B7XIW2_9EURO|nr:hypothetical protein AJ79_05853 [Helicocarpus griseus UAMH5409]